MRRPLLLARAIGGLIFIVALVGMAVFDFLYPELNMSREVMIMMSSMISVLLGVDIIFDKTSAISDTANMIKTLKGSSSEDNNDK